MYDCIFVLFYTVGSLQVKFCFCIFKLKFKRLYRGTEFGTWKKLFLKRIRSCRCSWGRNRDRCGRGRRCGSIQLFHHLLLLDEHLLEQIQMLLQIFQLHLTTALRGWLRCDGSLNLVKHPVWYVSLVGRNECDNFQERTALNLCLMQIIKVDINKQYKGGALI